jgi:hypothetical protein
VLNVRAALLLVTLAPTAFAAVASRQSCIPVVGKWRGSSSTLALTNTTSRPVRVTLSWIIGSPRDYSPPPFQLLLSGNETRLIDVGKELLHGREAAGGLRIDADAHIGAQAIVFARPGGDPAAFNAVPTGDAIGTGETTTLAGIIGSGGFRLFVAETKGHPIYFSATAVVGDDRRGERRYYVEPLHQASLTIDRDFGLKAGEAFTLMIRAVNGSGRLVVAGGAITATQDIVATEMLVPTKPRHRMRWPEMLVYAAIALALVTAAVYGRKSRHVIPSREDGEESPAREPLGANAGDSSLRSE